MSTFTFLHNGTSGTGAPIYDVRFDDPRGGRKYLGLVTRERGTWTTWVRGQMETGYRTRTAAAERLLLVAACNPAAAAALPTDPFDGLAAVTP